MILKCSFLLIPIYFCSAMAISQDTISTDSLQPPPNRKIKKIERLETIDGKAEEVFAFMDDIDNTGMHMTEENGPMMGNKLTLEWI